MRKIFKKMVTITTTFIIAASIISGSSALAAQTNFKPGYVTGDFHTHTYLTDGNKSEAEVVKNAFEKYGLDWMANSEHGGTSARDPLGNAFTVPNSTTPTSLWRWITLKDYSFPIIQQLQKEYDNNVLIQGLEWNVPTHEHASVAIVSDSAVPVSDFEYMFDNNDKDNSRAFENMVKTNKTHADAVAGAQWLQNNYQYSSYFLINHPSENYKIY